MARLGEHTGITAEAIQTLKEIMVNVDYAQRFNYCGVLVMPGRKQYRRDGSEHTWEDVPFAKVLDEVESRIGKQTRLSVEERLLVLDKVMAGIERGPNPKTPKWAVPPLDPNKEPVHPWSASRAVRPRLACSLRRPTTAS